MNKKSILLTGATGNMGQAGLKELIKDKHNKVRVFSLKTKKDMEILKPYMSHPQVEVMWGDLTEYGSVRKAVEDMEIVLHVGALVSPQADRQPELAWKVNYGGTKNIVDAILEREDHDRVTLLYVGTVAETGNRASSVHWGRIGDPLLPSVFDYYALSKIAAERYVIESGLKRWVSVRQTGILHENLLGVNDGIGYHQPMDTHMEWVTVHDSGRLLAKVCSDEVPDELFGHCYNIGGGESCRLTAYDFSSKVFGMVGVKPEEVYDLNMFAARNFHGQYYLDSDSLNDLLGFRSQSVDDILVEIKKRMPFSMKLMRFLPRRVIKNSLIKEAKKNPNTPLYWIEHDIHDKIDAFFGSKEDWNSIGDWEQYKAPSDTEPVYLNHGYDESKADTRLNIEDMKETAAFRGGICLSKSMHRGDLTTKLRWRCSEGHEFEASPYLILKTGHWCGECLGTPWNFDDLARKSHFLAQVWHVDHDPEENKRYMDEDLSIRFRTGLQSS